MGPIIINVFRCPKSFIHLQDRFAQSDKNIVINSEKKTLLAAPTILGRVAVTLNRG